MPTNSIYNEVKIKSKKTTNRLADALEKSFANSVNKNHLLNKVKFQKHYNEIHGEKIKKTI